MGFRVLGFGVRVKGAGYMHIRGLICYPQTPRSRVEGSGVRVQVLWFRGYGLCFGFEAMGLLVHDLWFMILG